MIFYGQITLDGTLAPKPIPPLSGPDYAITHNFGQIVDSNLFHSFSEFNLSAMESATFSGPPSIVNILSRVTGGNASSIDGLIRSKIPGANFFLINPAGIMIGPNARLDVSGSAIMSTAGYLELEDEGRFDAVTPTNSVLTAANSSAFGFVNNPTGFSINKSKLSVAAGQSLSLIGGEAEIVGGFLRAPGGNMNIISVGSPGKVEIDVTAPNPEITLNSISQLGDIHFTDGLEINVDGEGGGGIIIQGADLSMTDVTISSETFDSIDGRNINILSSENLNVSNTSKIQTVTSGNGNGGNIVIQSQGMIVTNGAQIRTDTEGPGVGGSIEITMKELEINAQESRNFTGIASQNNSDMEDSRSGNISVIADILLLKNGGKISSSTFNSGDTGNITVEASDILIEGKNQFTATGLFTDSINESDGGKSGDVTITADEIDLIGPRANISARTMGDGESGIIIVEARKLFLDGQGARNGSTLR